MADKRHPNFAKLANARILEWAAYKTLEDVGCTSLHEKFLSGQHLVDGQRQCYYLELDGEDRDAARHGGRVAHLIAKYLLLNGKQHVRVASLTDLNFLAEARHLNRDVEIDERLASTLTGNGYLVVPYFLAANPVPTEEIFTKIALQEIGDKLAAHVYDGGGLVLAGLPVTHPGLQNFSGLSDLIETRFEVHRLHSKEPK